MHKDPVGKVPGVEHNTKYEKQREASVTETQFSEGHMKGN